MPVSALMFGAIRPRLNEQVPGESDQVSDDQVAELEVTEALLILSDAGESDNQDGEGEE